MGNPNRLLEVRFGLVLCRALDTCVVAPKSVSASRVVTVKSVYSVTRLCVCESAQLCKAHVTIAALLMAVSSFTISLNLVMAAQIIVASLNRQCWLESLRNVLATSTWKHASCQSWKLCCQ